MMAKVPGIVSGPVTDGFIRGGRETDIGVSDWAERVSFVSGPVDAPSSWINRDAECDGVLDDQRTEIDTLTDKVESSTYIDGPFYPWPVYQIVSCIGDDIVRPEDEQLVEDKVNSVRSSKFAQEFSDGIWSGSPSLRSTAVPISNTAFSLTNAIMRLVDQRVSVEASGPHFVHLPAFLKPMADSLHLESNDVYRLVFDNYVKSYVPDEDILNDSGKAVAPTSNQAWIAVTGPYEYASSPIETEAVKTIEARKANKKLVRSEQQLFYRYETANTFLAKVTVFS